MNQACIRARIGNSILPLVREIASENKKRTAALYFASREGFERGVWIFVVFCFCSKVDISGMVSEVVEINSLFRQPLANSNMKHLEKDGLSARGRRTRCC